MTRWTTILLAFALVATVAFAAHDMPVDTPTLSVAEWTPAVCDATPSLEASVAERLGLAAVSWGSYTGCAEDYYQCVADCNGNFGCMGACEWAYRFCDEFP